MSKFTITSAKGFQMTFKNGWTISVQFGIGNYCDNKYRAIVRTDDISCEDAEIAIWDEEGKWYNFGSDEVKGYCSADEVAEWIDKVKNF